MASSSEDEIDRAVAEEEAQVIPEVDTVGGALALALLKGSERPEYMRFTGCVFSKEMFSKGWHFLLLSRKYARNFSIKQSQLEKMDWKKRADFIFRLTVWFAKRGRAEPPNSTRPKDIQLGSVVLCERVGDLETYKGVYPQGTTTGIQVIEQPVAPTTASARAMPDRAPKKTKTSA